MLILDRQGRQLPSTMPALASRNDGAIIRIGGGDNPTCVSGPAPEPEERAATVAAWAFERGTERIVLAELPAVADSPLVLCASFVVADAAASFLRDQGCEDVTFVITGEDGKADEDLACAQYVARQAPGEAAVDAAEFVSRARLPLSRWRPSLALAQIRQNRQHAAVRIVIGRQVELGEDASSR